jgi:sigma-B regulation protein RsbU (phosphoserine phosphatase)
LVAAVDRDVYGTTDGARYATAIYGVIDAGSSQLTVVNAGHPAALVVSQSGQARTLAATGPALGLIEAGTFGTHRHRLEPGALFLAYTDGVSEALDHEGNEYGETRLLEVIESARAAGAAAICSALLDSVRAFRGQRQDQDDVTVMVVKALEHGAERAS